jgi:hypothetical protein
MSATARNARTAIATVALLAILLGGCVAGIVYNRLDWAAVWYVDGFVTLDESQKRQLRELVQQTLDWHRRTQLSRYRRLLNDLEREISRPLTPADVNRRFEQITGLMDDLAGHIVPEAAPLLLTLDADQLRELERNLAEHNEELWEEYAGSTPEVRRQRRTRTTLRALQRFTGRLNGAQRELVETQLASLQDVSEQWIERRVHWQERFMALLRGRPEQEQFVVALRKLVLDPNQFDSPEYRARVESNRDAVMRMLSDLSATFDERQRSRFARKLNGYALDIEALSASP